MLFVSRVVITEPTLIACHEIHILWNSASQPFVPTGILQIPHFSVINKLDAEAFGRAILLDKRTQTLHAFTGGMNIGKHEIEHTVLCQSIGNQRVSVQCLGTAEDDLCAAHADAQTVKTGTAPFSRKQIAGSGIITQPLCGQTAAERTVLSDKRIWSELGILVLFKVDGVHGIPVHRTGNDP